MKTNTKVDLYNRSSHLNFFFTKKSNDDGYRRSQVYLCVLQWDETKSDASKGSQSARCRVGQDTTLIQLLCSNLSTRKKLLAQIQTEQYFARRKKESGLLPLGAKPSSSTLGNKLLGATTTGKLLEEVCFGGALLNNYHRVKSICSSQHLFFILPRLFR